MEKVELTDQNKLVTFSGASDDLVLITGAPGCDEYHSQSLDGEWNVLSMQKGYWSGSWDLVSSQGRMRVHALYDGMWSFASSKVDEDDVWVGWPISVGQSPDREYSMLLTVEVPSDTRVEVVAS